MGLTGFGLRGRKSGLRSAKLKLARAATHLRSIKRGIAKYSASRPHKIIRKPKGRKKINIPIPPPREISLLAGEMVYQMRSALDHLAFEVVSLNPNVGAIDPNWQEHCQFPLRTKLPSGSKPPLAKANFAKDLPGISDKMFTYIERIQPYYRSGWLNTSLGFLAHLSNIDKHRHLNLIRPRIRKSEKVRFRSGKMTGRYETLERGAIVGVPDGQDESDRVERVNRQYRAFASFSEGRLGDATTFPVDVLLEAILYHINKFVVPEFEKFVKNP